LLPDVKNRLPRIWYKAVRKAEEAKKLLERLPALHHSTLHIFSTS